MGKKKYTKKEVKDNIKNYVSYLKKEHNLPVKKVYLYGSYAKNKQRDWSDVDVCIVSPKFKRIDSISYLFRRRRMEDVRNSIEPIGFSPNDFKDKYDSLINEIKTTGIEVRV
jgi:uncharacterized protein